MSPEVKRRAAWDRLSPSRRARACRRRSALLEHDHAASRRDEAHLAAIATTTISVGVLVGGLIGLLAVMEQGQGTSPWWFVRGTFIVAVVMASVVPLTFIGFWLHRAIVRFLDARLPDVIPPQDERSLVRTRWDGWRVRPTRGELRVRGARPDEIDALR